MVKLIVFRLHPYNTISFILFAPMLKIQLFLNFFTKKKGRGPWKPCSLFNFQWSHLQI